ncbi:MAG: MFS transporter [Thermoplasmata archaeon]
MEDHMTNKREFLFVAAIIISMTFGIRASNNMYMTTVPLLAKYYFDYSEFFVGAISAAGATGTLVMSALINSRLGPKLRRKVFIASSFIYMVIFPVFYISNRFLIWPVVIIAGFVLGAIMPNIITSASLFNDRKTRERILSMYTLTLSISLVAGPAIESEILRVYPLTESFLFFSILPISSFAMSFFIKFPEESQKEKKVGGNIARNSGFVAAILNIMTYNIPFALILTFGGIYAKDAFNASYSLITLMFSLFFMTSFASRVMLTIKTPEKLWLLMGLSVLITSSGLIVLAFSNNIYIFAASFMMLGFPHGFTYPLSVISISRSFQPSERSAANSYFFSVMMLIGAVMPFVSGIMVDAIGMKTSFLSVIPVILVLLILLRREIISMRTSMRSVSVI